MKKFRLIFAVFIASAVEGSGSAMAAASARGAFDLANAETPVTPPPGKETSTEDLKTGNPSGNYLSSIFAQRHHDWSNAKSYLSDVIDQNPEDSQLLKRAMVLAVGSGNVDIGITLAHKLLSQESASGLALLFTAAESYKKKDYDDGDQRASHMPKDGLSNFLVPLLKAWSQAGRGHLAIADLDKNVIHMRHAVLIADMAGQYEPLDAMLRSLLENPERGAADKAVIGDIYAHIGQTQTALALYNEALRDMPDSEDLPQKIAALKAGKNRDLFEHPKTAQDGMAIAMFDMAKLLYNEYADDSARVFAHLALYLNPSVTDADLLLASITARNDRIDEAIDYYRKIEPSSPYYIEAHHKIADLYLEAGDKDKALRELEMLVAGKGDPESMIKIGDIYRQSHAYGKALESYNRAADKLGTPLPSQYWYVLYVRGMCYERTGEWSLAEKDLKAALQYQPNHPYVLNYLGYAWADRGVNLDEALAMVKKAASLEPNDGYIVDSLGWIYYKMKRFNDAVDPLERAVQLLPSDPVINAHLGDAYRRVGRLREARFQWQRALGFTQDESLIETLNAKIARADHPEPRPGPPLMGPDAGDDPPDAPPPGRQAP